MVSASENSYLSHLDSKATLSDAVSAELLRASLDYMRTPSRERQEGGNAGQCWIVDSIPAHSRSSSSPVLACPPSWLHDEQEHSDLETENEDEFLPSEVPLSSSPPDLTSSSPQSDGSDSSDGTSTSLTSSPDVYLADSVSVSRLHSSLVDLPTGASLVLHDFGTRLQYLLLIALKERQREGHDLASPPDRINDLSDCDSDDCGHDSSDGSSGISDNGSDKNENTTVERTCLRTPRKGSGCLDHFEPCSLSLSNGLRKVSPACFTVNDVTEDGETRKSDPSKAYRLIKRSQSYRPVDEPQVKRQKVARDQGPHAKDRIYAHRTASLRRADSLRSAPGDRSPASNDWVATVPATPVPATPKQRGHASSNTSEFSRVSMDPVPIIAPPEDHVAKLPLSPETLAKIRLTRYLEREVNGRDGILLGLSQRSPHWAGRGSTAYDWPLLPDKSTSEGNATSEWENALGIGRKRREAAINWLLDVLANEDTEHTSSPVSCSSSSSKSSSCSSSFSKSSSILHSSGGSSSRCTTNTPVKNASHSGTRFNLQDQLQNSPETRFHAAWMFLSYFHLTTSPEASPHSSRSSSKSCSVDEEGLDLVVWDIAITCLAISVKFHRDFLDPLLPVFAREYVALAPHHISHEDLESAHRDVLSAFDYKLGVTPQPVMDELWLALPSLRGLLDFDGGWKRAMAGAWTRLFIALDEPDVQRFLVSMLTVVALMDGIIESLTDQYCRAAVGKLQRRPTVEDHYRDVRLARKKSCAKAKDEAEGVFCDIQALTGITDVDLRGCRLWMTRRK